MLWGNFLEIAFPKMKTHQVVCSCLLSISTTNTLIYLKIDASNRFNIENKEKLVEWEKLNAQLCRLELNSNTALKNIEIYNDIVVVRADEHPLKNIFQSLPDTKYPHLPCVTIKNIYCEMLKKV